MAELDVDEVTISFGSFGVDDTETADNDDAHVRIP